jgi:hypothetical protein
MTEPDDLTESLRHVEYEMAMMVATPRMVKLQLTAPGPSAAARLRGGGGPGWGGLSVGNR